MVNRFFGAKRVHRVGLLGAGPFRRLGYVLSGPRNSPRSIITVAVRLSAFILWPGPMPPLKMPPLSAKSFPARDEMGTVSGRNRHGGSLGMADGNRWARRVF